MLWVVLFPKQIEVPTESMSAHNFQRRRLLACPCACHRLPMLWAMVYRIIQSLSLWMARPCDQEKEQLFVSDKDVGTSICEGIGHFQEAEFEPFPPILDLDEGSWENSKNYPPLTIPSVNPGITNHG